MCYPGAFWQFTCWSSVLDFGLLESLLCRRVQVLYFVSHTIVIADNIWAFMNASRKYAMNCMRLSSLTVAEIMTLLTDKKIYCKSCVESCEKQVLSSRFLDELWLISVWCLKLLKVIYELNWYDYSSDRIAKGCIAYRSLLVALLERRDIMRQFSSLVWTLVFIANYLAHYSGIV